VIGTFKPPINEFAKHHAFDLSASGTRRLSRTKDGRKLSCASMTMNFKPSAVLVDAGRNMAHKERERHSTEVSPLLNRSGEHRLIKRERCWFAEPAKKLVNQISRLWTLAEHETGL